MYGLSIAIYWLSLTSALSIFSQKFHKSQNPAQSSITVHAYSSVTEYPTPTSPFRISDNESMFEMKVGDMAGSFVSNFAKVLSNPAGANTSIILRQQPLVKAALDRIDKDMNLLDDDAGKSPQLTRLELIVLFGAVIISALSPYILSLEVSELLVPSMAALSASVGISAEYSGKVAIANGKEVAAYAIQATAESEVFLARAERAKAILPLCVGVATTASAFALLAPTFLREIGQIFNAEVIVELYLACPIIAVLAAAVAGLATQESIGLAKTATGVGIRRFSSSARVGRTWLSQTDQVMASSRLTTEKWKSFALGVAPAPVFAALTPGPLFFKSIICAAVAAAQAAYCLSLAEYAMAEATESVAIKARNAAVADAYASQGSRAGSILPFTSALAGLCCAASAAAVELLPIIGSIEAQSLIALLFPLGGSVFAAVASVAKAKCEVDTSAAIAAADALGENPKRKDPLQITKELIVLSVRSSWKRVFASFIQIKNFIFSGNLLGAIFRGPTQKPTDVIIIC